MNVAKSIVVLVILLLVVPMQAAASLHDSWGELLKAHVQDGNVDYQGFKTDEQKLDGYLSQLAAADTNAMAEQELLAFYINGYNAYTIKLILDNFEDGKPVDSIKDIGSFFSTPWKIRFAEMAGETLTLDNIEHDIIRQRFDEPRIHFAVNCASISCPPLISEPYTGEKLERQLQENTVNFLNDPDFNYLSGNTLHVSKIFKWFSEDFEPDVATFVKQFATGEFKAGLEAAGENLKVRYLDYDWSLNTN